MQTRMLSGCPFWGGRSAHSSSPGCFTGSQDTCGTGQRDQTASGCERIRYVCIRYVRIPLDSSDPLPLLLAVKGNEGLLLNRRQIEPYRCLLNKLRNRLFLVFLKLRRNPFHCLSDLFSLGLNGSHRRLLYSPSVAQTKSSFTLLLQDPAIKIAFNLICVLDKINVGVLLAGIPITK